MNQRSVETFLHTSIKDEMLPTHIEGFEPGIEFIHNLLENCPVVATHPLAQKGLVFGVENPYGPDTDDEIELVQLTRKHGRSFEVCHPDAQGVWRDEYGHLYSSINLKGNNFSNPHAMKTATAPDGYIAFGLQESSVSRRVLRASRIMRENGIGTEYILGMAEPKAFGWPTVDNKTNSLEFLDLPQYKQKLVEESWKQLGDEQKTAETYVEMARAFERMTFLVSTRAMDTSYRYYDVMHNNEAAKVVFSLINEHLRDENQPELHPTDPKDMLEYVTDYVTPSAAKNLARLHYLGLAHRFPNDLNVTGLGSLVDLDSVHGEALDLGDDAITPGDIANDILHLANGLRDRGIFGLLSQTGDMGPGITERVMSAYINEVCELFMASGQSVEAFEAYVLRLAAAVHDQIPYVTNEEMLTTAIQLEKSSMDAYNAVAAPPEVEQANELVEAWVNTYWDYLEPYLEQKIIDELPKTLDRLFSDYMNERGVPFDFDLIKELIDGDSQAAVFTRSRLATDVLFALTFVYTGHISEDPNPKDELAFDRDAVTRLLTADYADWEEMFFDKARVLVENVLQGQLTTHTAETEKAEIPYLFRDKKSHALFLAAPGTYVYETNHVTVEDIQEYLNATYTEVTLEPYNSMPPARSTSCEVTRDGSKLIQIVTELPTDGSSYALSSQRPAIHVDVAELGYVMFVELKPDGTHRLRIQHPHADRVLHKQPLSSKQIVDFLQANSASGQGEFFDKDIYYNPKKPPFEIGFVVESELLKYLQI